MWKSKNPSVGPMIFGFRTQWGFFSWVHKIASWLKTWLNTKKRGEAWIPRVEMSKNHPQYKNFPQYKKLPSGHVVLACRPAHLRRFGMLTGTLTILLVLASRGVVLTCRRTQFLGMSADTIVLACRRTLFWHVNGDNLVWHVDGIKPFGMSTVVFACWRVISRWALLGDSSWILGDSLGTQDCEQSWKAENVPLSTTRDHIVWDLYVWKIEDKRISQLINPQATSKRWISECQQFPWISNNQQTTSEVRLHMVASHGWTSDPRLNMLGSFGQCPSWA